MEAMRPFMIIADFETSTNSSNQVKPYSFAMVIHFIYNINNNKLSHYTGNNCLNEFFEQLINHVDHIGKITAKTTLQSNPKAYISNPINRICLIWNDPIKTENNAHGYRYYCKKQDTYTDLNMVVLIRKNKRLLYYFIMVQNLILDQLSNIWRVNV